MPRSPLLWIAALVIVVGSLGVHHAGVGSHASARVAGAVVLALVAVAAVFAAGRWPRAAVVLAGAATGGYFAAGLHNGPIFLATPIVLLVVALGHPPRLLVPAGVVAIALGVAGLAVRAGVHEAPWGEAFWEATGHVALSVGACAMGWWLADRRATRAAQARRAASEEQLRMARELHDGVGHGLAVIAMQAGVALHVLERDPAAVRRSLEAIRETSQESLDALRAELASIAGDTGGTAPRRPAPGPAELDALLDRVRSGGLAVVQEGVMPAVSEAAGRAAYAVVQESLTNVLRHAHASTVAVGFAEDGADLVVTVVDDGVGGSGGGSVEDEGMGLAGMGLAGMGLAGMGLAGMGLAGMRSRVEALGGTCTAGPDARRGFRVEARIPVDAGAVA